MAIYMLYFNYATIRPSFHPNRKSMLCLLFLLRQYNNNLSKKDTKLLTFEYIIIFTLINFHFEPMYMILWGCKLLAVSRSTRAVYNMYIVIMMMTGDEKLSPFSLFILLWPHIYLRPLRKSHFLDMTHFPTKTFRAKVGNLY